MTLKKILCAIDLSDFAAPVLAHGVALAREYGATVAAVHVVPRESAGQRDLAATQLRKLVERFVTATTVTQHVIDGDAAQEIVRHAAAWESDLLVLGTHGRSGFDRLALGSVAEKVLRKAPCPVMTLPPGMPAIVGEVRHQHLLCPTDFSECSGLALDFAIALARNAAADITLLRVVEAFDADAEWSGEPWVAELRARQCAAETTALRELMASRRHTGCTFQDAVALGKPYQEILRAAEERRVDLIVMGVRGRGPVDTTLFGSTTNQVVRRAACPVITVRNC